MDIKVVVAQKGTREYFLAARALHRRNCLSQMVVDWYTPFRGRLGKKINRSSIANVSRAFSAHSDELPDSLVRRMLFYGLYARFHNKFLTRWGLSSRLIDADRIYAKKVARLKLPKHNVFFSYSYSSLEALTAEKSRGVFTVLDQIDPGELEREIIVEEEKRWPQYVLQPLPYFPGSFDRNNREWDNADVIVVNSHWSKECIEKKGCDSHKIEVLPLAYERNAVSAHPIKTPPPLKVLWLGRITLQKGIPYLVEAAKLLNSVPVEIFIAGYTDISENAIEESPPNMKWLGSVSVNKKMELYRSSHVFVLPTLSDGFAITQLEAFAHGMPVITTRHCGKVVEDGKTGYIVPARDPSALAKAILRFLNKPALITEMGERCRMEVEAYSIDAYADGLMNIIKKRIV